MPERIPQILDGVARGVITVEPYHGGWIVRGAVGDLLIEAELERAGAAYSAKKSAWVVGGNSKAAAAFAVAETRTRTVQTALALRRDRATQAGLAATDGARKRLQKRASREIKAVYQQALMEHKAELKEVMARFAAASDPVEAIKLGYRRDELNAVINSLSNGLANAGSEAARAVEGLLPETRRVARDIASWHVENLTGMRVSRLLGNRDAVEALETTYSRVKYREKDVSRRFIADMMGRNKYDSRAWANISSPKKAEKQLRNAISRGLLTGEHPDKIAARIDGVFNQWEGRAKTIARTETARVMSATQQELYAEAAASGVGIKNRWEATLDGATRHTHRKVDGEIRAIGEKFSNGCIRPGEGGIAAEVINCRCALVPVVEGFKPDWDMRRDNSAGRAIPYQTYNEWAKDTGAQQLPASVTKAAPQQAAPMRTSYTMKELGTMNRAELEGIAAEVSRKNAAAQGITEAEAMRRFNLLVDSNTTPQLRKYINRNGK